MPLFLPSMLGLVPTSDYIPQCLMSTLKALALGSTLPRHGNPSMSLETGGLRYGEWPVSTLGIACKSSSVSGQTLPVFGSEPSWMGSTIDEAQEVSCESESLGCCLCPPLAEARAILSVWSQCLHQPASSHSLPNFSRWLVERGARGPLVLLNSFLLNKSRC